MQVPPLKDMPSLLCCTCVGSLTSAYKFREMCQESERTFASSVVKVFPEWICNFAAVLTLILTSVFKAELKLEPTDEATQLENDTVEYIYEPTNEFIDADEDIEFDAMLEERLEDTIEEAETDEMPYEDFDRSNELDEKNLMLGNASDDSDYNPSERLRKPKVRKTRHNKRGRGRPRNAHSVLKHSHPKAGAIASAAVANKSNEETSTNIMCEICGNIYSKRAALNIHMRRHMSEKPFECEWVFD